MWWWYRGLNLASTRCFEEMAPVVLSEFSLAVDIDTFLELFWRDTQWYEEFLTEKLLDLSVNVEEWAPSAENPAIQARTVKSYHPSKISFPGLPSHAEVHANVVADTVGIMCLPMICLSYALRSPGKPRR